MLFEPPYVLFKLAAAVAVVASLFLADRLLLGRDKSAEATQRLRGQMIMLALTLLAAVVVILLLPLPEATQGRLLGLLGLLLTGVIGVSSTTFVSNAMAGVMIRSMRHFGAGDFVRVGDYFGRITELGLFHTELQTEDRDLAALPNMFLVSQPVQVVRASGTIISATVSLGYDVAHDEIERLLMAAAAASELQDPFVRIEELGDFSVTYRIAGFLEDPIRMLTVRSNLRRRVLDTLHEGGVEIVSPSFMNQRVLDKDRRFIPRPNGKRAEHSEPERAPEEIIFDKADAAKQLEDLRREKAALEKETAELQEQLSGGTDEARKRHVTADVARRTARIAEIDGLLAAAEEAKQRHDD